MITGFVAVTLKEGQQCWVGIDHILSIEPLAEDPHHLAVIKLAATSTYFDAAAKRWLTGPTGYIVHGTAQEVAESALQAQQDAQGRVFTGHAD